MRLVCNCPIGDDYRRFWKIHIRAIIQTISFWVVTVVPALALAKVGFVSDDTRRWIVLASGIMGACLWLTWSAESRPRPNWSALGTSDWVSIVYFAPLTAIGWWQVFAEDYRGPKLTWLVVGATVFLCFFSYEIVLRIPPRVDRFKRKHLQGALSVEFLTEEHLLRAHKLRCKRRSQSWLDRHNAYVRRAAERRKRDRDRGSATNRVYRWLASLVDAYTSTPSWLSAFFTSASLFVGAFTFLSPGPLGILILFSPFILVGPVDMLRRRLCRSESNASEAQKYAVLQSSSR